MAKKKEIKKKKHAGTGYTCGECARGEWNTDNFNYRGDPFQIYCEHSTYAYSPRRACGTCFDNTPACECFKAGERPSRRASELENERRQGMTCALCPNYYECQVRQIWRQELTGADCNFRTFIDQVFWKGGGNE